jgi:flagellar hook-basal body complex protein FliE
MSLIGSIGSLSASPYGKIPNTMITDAAKSIGMPNDTLKAAGIGAPVQTPEAGFTNLFENMIESVNNKQNEAKDISKQVLLGQNDQLHQSVIAMQEASVAFTLMIEVRNKLVDSYQELMRLPV